MECQTNISILEQVVGHIADRPFNPLHYVYSSLPLAIRIKMSTKKHIHMSVVLESTVKGGPSITKGKGYLTEILEKTSLQISIRHM